MSGAEVEQVPSIRPAVFSGHGICAAVSTRRGGVSPEPLGMNLSFTVGDDPGNVGRNRERWFGSLGIPTSAVAFSRQVHGTSIVDVTGPGEKPSCDGMMTNTPSLFLAITIADCLPLLLYAPDVKTVAAVHAGWRGAAAGIAGDAVLRMQQVYGADPSLVSAYVGPCASRCCYEVHSDVATQASWGSALHHNGGRYFLDLKDVVVRQLRENGVQEKHIEISPACTIHESARFHSFRRDGSVSGRMMAVIGIVSKDL